MSDVTPHEIAFAQDTGLVVLVQRALFVRLAQVVHVTQPSPGRVDLCLQFGLLLAKIMQSVG